MIACVAATAGIGAGWGMIIAIGGCGTTCAAICFDGVGFVGGRDATTVDDAAGAVFVAIAAGVGGSELGMPIKRELGAGCMAATSEIEAVFCWGKMVFCSIEVKPPVIALAAKIPATMALPICWSRSTIDIIKDFTGQ